jgi:small subunit ribosomal protein S6
MFIISPLHASDDEVAAIIQRIEQSIEDAEGEVTSVNHRPPWGRRKFAYPIRAYAGGEASRRSFTDGFYVLMHFTVPASKIQDIEYTIKFMDAILRHLITIVEKKSPLETTLPAQPVEEPDEEKSDSDEEEENWDDNEYDEEGDAESNEEETDTA